MVRATALVLLLLSGCSDQKSMWRESEIRQIAEDESDAATESLRTRISELEAEIEHIKDVNARQDVERSYRR